MFQDNKQVLRRLDAARDLTWFMAEYYYELNEAADSDEQKAAWCTSVGPAELLCGMGYHILSASNPIDRLAGSPT